MLSIKKILQNLNSIGNVDRDSFLSILKHAIFLKRFKLDQNASGTFKPKKVKKSSRQQLSVINCFFKNKKVTSCLCEKM